MVALETDPLEIDEHRPKGRTRQSFPREMKESEYEYEYEAEAEGEGRTIQTVNLVG